MTDRLLKLIGEKYPLTPVDVGEFAALKASGMKFDIRAFKAEGLGHVSVMKAGGMLGLMKMDTVIINPETEDLPLYSYDRILAMGNDTLITELYDTVVGAYRDDPLIAVKERFKDLPERDPGEHWYDSIKLSSSISKKGKKCSEAFDRLTEEHFKAYLASSAGTLSSEEALAKKREKTNAYVEGLLSKGGPSTDAFKKALGTEKTGELFRKVLFGTM